MKITIDFNDFESITRDKEREKSFLTHLLAIQDLGVKVNLLNKEKEILLIVNSPSSYETVSL